jgi:hypothetical protein
LISQHFHPRSFRPTPVSDEFRFQFRSSNRMAKVLSMRSLPAFLEPEELVLVRELDRHQEQDLELANQGSEFHFLFPLTRRQS